jgi:hypothetical protein
VEEKELALESKVKKMHEETSNILKDVKEQYNKYPFLWKKKASDPSKNLPDDSDFPLWSCKPHDKILKRGDEGVPEYSESVPWPNGLGFRYDPTSDQGGFGDCWKRHEDKPLIKHMVELSISTKHHVTIWRSDFKGSSTNPFPDLPEIIVDDLAGIKNREDELLPKSIANLLRNINKDRNYLITHYTRLLEKAKTRLERSKKWQADTGKVVKTKMAELEKIEAELAKAREEKEAMRIKEVHIDTH